jgi:transcriptional regulator of heat shock response
VKQTQQLLEESKQHSERLIKLAGENQAHWESLEKKQEETSVVVFIGGEFELGESSRAGPHF